MVLQLLVDEQINPRVAPALREKGVQAVSVHELRLANQGFQDEALLALATNRQATLLTLDSDFTAIHAAWQAANRRHCGIFYGETDKYQHTGAIGILVRFCVYWSEVLGDDTQALEENVYNEIQYIQEP